MEDFGVFSGNFQNFDVFNGIFSGILAFLMGFEWEFFEFGVLNGI